jgi:hypothetical protein
MKFLILLTVAFLSAGCDLIIGSVVQSCEAVGHFGIYLVVADSVTLSPLPDSVEITAVARDGMYVDSIVMPGGIAIPLADERGGTYSVDFSVAGYRHWKQNDVTVRRTGDCDDIRTEHLRALLVRQVEAAAGIVKGG